MYLHIRQGFTTRQVHPPQEVEEVEEAAAVAAPLQAEVTDSDAIRCLVSWVAGLSGHFALNKELKYD